MSNALKHRLKNVVHLTIPAVLQSSSSMDSSGSTPASPASATGEPGPRPAPAQLGDSNINSKSLPNIPSR